MQDHSEQPRPVPRPVTKGGLPTWAIGPAFLAVAALLYFAPPQVDVPRGKMNVVSRDLFIPGARRQHIGNPPSVVIGGYSHACNECHRLFDSPPVERRTLVQHTEIVFRHGMNNRCFNCHDRTNREKLVLHDGTAIGFDQVPRLCSQCHGTVFRDWQLGTHGKTMGSWDASSGKQRRLECNDCHDPHSPAYRPIQPLPAPDTLRMGVQTHIEEPLPRHTPLRRWSSPQEETKSPGSDAPTEKETHP